LEIGDNKRVLEIRDYLLTKGYLIGAIRRPTVKRALLRVTLNLGVKLFDLKKALVLIKELVNDRS
ncbi:MAG: pyridoxal phosphate-dependent aminotransferase family protein, partial [Epsilonproteobacteria bacterium]|nr:pyridoxal phosphate-dependent aminotransferase family protein [Campylobacterota bacterium]